MTNYLKGFIGPMLTSSPMFNMDLEPQLIFFIVLIALSLILILVIMYLIRMISRLTKIVLNDEKKDKGADTLQARNNNEPNYYGNRYEEISLDDKELVAVITAAVMAYLGDEAPTAGLVVRSIRKVNKRKHSNNYGV